MKRGKMALLLVVALFMVSGCGKEQTLNCTMDIDSMGVTMKYGIDIDFKGSSVDDMNVSVEVEYPEGITEEQKTLMTSTIKTQLESQGLEGKETENGMKLTAGKDSPYFSGLDYSGKLEYDDAKKYFEAAGYTCK